MTENNLLEVLAPVGDMERLYAALDFGADAVYLGGTAFGMRAASASFDAELLKKACDEAHSRGKRVYLTCKTLPHNDEIVHLEQFVNDALAAGVDAKIANDIGVFSLIKKYAPDMEIHVSTQAGIVNYVTANEFYNMGAKRVVLARELSLEEIAEIRAKTPKDLEIECFVHGAMCVSFSGRCLLSQYLVNRDANRGECAQPCRWGYHLMEEKRTNEFYPVFEDEKGTYILNAKDMCMLNHIDKLAEAGAKLCVETLKAIEDHTATFEKQGESPTEYARMLDKKLGNIDWNTSAVQIERLVRGLNSWPSAYTHWDKKGVKIWRAKAEADGTVKAEPGTVLSVEKDSFTVQTGDGVLRVLELQIPGKKRMDTGAFLRGYTIESGVKFTQE